MKVILRYLLIGLVVLIAVAIVLLFTPLGTAPLTTIFAAEEIERIDFATLELSGDPNQFLSCPPAYCGTTPHMESPVFDISADDLKARWQKVVAGQPRIEHLNPGPDGEQFYYVQRSRRFRFPDVITVRFIEISSSQSTLALFSRAIYGKSDLDVNRKRMESWMKALGEAP
jgi:uncharacterized protein (DUF1499 family)